jgi:flagellar hook-associated protein 3 FlgL
MRVSTPQLHRSSVNAILDQQAQSSRTQQQLATGKRLLAPSDDPAASAKILDLNQAVAVTGQYDRNIDAARNRLNREETALAGVQTVLQRVRELAIQANNDSQNNETRQGIALEVRQRLSDLLGYANTKDANGEYLFAGFQSHTQPFAQNPAGGFTYSGDQGQRFLQVGPDRQVATNDAGAPVFQVIRNGNGTFTTRDNAANIGSGVIDPGTVTDPTAYDGDTYTVLFPFTTSATGSLAFNDANGNDTLSYSLSIDGTPVYTVDETGTPLNTLQDLATQINGATGTTGVQAYVAGSTLYLARTTPGDTPITVTETLSGYTAGDGDQATGYFGATLTGDAGGASHDTVYTPGNADAYLVLDSADNIDASGSYQADGAITFNGVKTSVKGEPANGDRFSVAPSTNQDIFTTVQNLIDALETPSQGTADLAAFHNAVNRVLTDIDQSQANFSGVRSGVGARLNTLDDQGNVNGAAKLQLQEALSKEQDLDYASAASRFNLQLVALQAAQQAFVKLQGLSLFNFLR